MHHYNVQHTDNEDVMVKTFCVKTLKMIKQCFQLFF